MKRIQTNSNEMQLLFICKNRFIRNTYRSLFDYRAPGDHRLWQPAVRRGRGVAAAAAPALPPHTQLRGLHGLQSGADQAGAADAETERKVPDYRWRSCYRFRYVQQSIQMCVLTNCCCCCWWWGVGAGSVAGHLQHTPDLSLVWIDAHADINLHSTSQSGNIHGMPVSFLLQQLRGTWQHTGVDKAAPNW